MRAMPIGHLRNCVAYLEAEGFIAGLKLAGMEGRFIIREVPDRYAPLGCWFAVERES